MNARSELGRLYQRLALPVADRVPALFSNSSHFTSATPATPPVPVRMSLVVMMPLGVVIIVGCHRT